MRHIGKASEFNFTVHVMCLYCMCHIGLFLKVKQVLSLNDRVISSKSKHTANKYTAIYVIAGEELGICPGCMEETI